MAKPKDELEFENVWTVDGRICYVREGSRFPKTYYN